MTGRPQHRADGLPHTWMVSVVAVQTSGGVTVHGSRSWIVEAYDHPAALNMAAKLAHALAAPLTGQPTARLLTI
ncbi:hypothetical protein [Streptomyces sp. G1]|uniref:hypothetical protein n=1 Tax=Streptomyces sp. G1 TaxID=361572 RepID=UPI00202E9CD1|nr:hypothetical protein [Streptomyces sp. G1]MCM1965888.1 hypothetical protein [Streptomyces sp. G1]